MRDSDAPAVIEHAPVQAAAPAAVRQIEGIEAAARREELRNPFTYVHETRGTPVQGAPGEPGAADQAKPTGAPPSGAAERTPAPAPGTAAPVKKKEPVTLRGVVTGADGARMAILAQGEDSAVLSAGEKWRTYTVAHVADDSVTLETAHETIVLQRE